MARPPSWFARSAGPAVCNAFLAFTSAHSAATSLLICVIDSDGCSILILLKVLCFGLECISIVKAAIIEPFHRRTFEKIAHSLSFLGVLAAPVAATTG